MAIIAKFFSSLLISSTGTSEGGGGGSGGDKMKQLRREKNGEKHQLISILKGAKLCYFGIFLKS